MKKSTFVALIMGFTSVSLISLGITMALIHSWDMFNEGITFCVVGAVLALITIFVWRKMENKALVNFTQKGALGLVVAIVGALTFGIGLCLAMAYNQLIWGIVIGIAGVCIMLCLIPIIVGLKD